MYFFSIEKWLIYISMFKITILITERFFSQLAMFVRIDFPEVFFLKH